LWGKREQAARILATEVYQTLLRVSEVTIVVVVAYFDLAGSIA